MENELELTFEEAEVYLPQVIANEEIRKANEAERQKNEAERQENEEERKTNENERQENEADRENRMDDIEDEVHDLMTELTENSIAYCESYSANYTIQNETVGGVADFDVPPEATTKSSIEVYVNGFKIPTNKYLVTSTAKQEGVSIVARPTSITLFNPVDVVGTEVEVVAKRMTTALQKDYDSLKANALDIYNTYESKTNKIWIDGKEIYRKVIVDYTLNTDYSFNHNITSIDTITSLTGYFDNGVEHKPIGYMEMSTLTADYVSASATRTTIDVKTSSGYRDYGKVFIIEYTKLA